MASIGDRSSVGGLGLNAGAIAEDAGIRLGLAAIGVLALFRLILAATTDLAEDEAYYWLWSTHLAASYYDHPPMIAYWIRAGTTIFGDTAIGVRFVGLLSSLAGSYLLYCTSLSLFRDRSAALLCVIWLNATLLLNAAAIIATPDTPLAFFVTLTLFALAKLIETGRGVWWYGIGAALGLAFMSKYTAVLLLPGVFLWIIASAEGRRWFKRPEPYLGAAIAMFIVAPVFYWNYAHDWTSFAKQAGHGIKDKPANALLSIAELFGGQAGLASPIIFAFCLFGSFYALLRGLRRRDPRWLLLGAIAVPVFVFFFVHAASQKIQANWPGLVYPVAILAAVHSFLAFREEKQASRWIDFSFRFAPWLGISFTLAAFLQLGLGVLPIEAKKDPTARLKGWAKLGRDVERLQRDYGAAAVLTDRYAITGELAFYSSKQQPVWQINERIRYANLPAPDETRLKNAPALLVLRKGGDPARASSHFENSRPLTTLQREAGFHSRDAYDVHLLTGYRGGLFDRVKGRGCGAAPTQDRACN
ncbi:MAG: glycosyltransferase family 39 protein [Rhodomicrobium sp.]|nr:glycosyltransferase family 39 protein [Rhodomicrobium sp.]